MCLQGSYMVCICEVGWHIPDGKRPPCYPQGTKENSSMQAAGIPASNSEVEAVENDQSVHAPASSARPRAVQSRRHQFEEYSYCMNGMQRTQNLQQQTLLSQAGLKWHQVHTNLLQ